MNVGIVGLGLIGGCLGMDLRSRGHTVYGVARRQHTCDRALTLGAVDKAAMNVAVLQLAEVVFVCVPIEAIAPTVADLKGAIATETVITDVGSVKTPVVEAVAPLWQNFVPGHPMAGKAEASIEAAELGLFAQRPYVFTPTPSTPKAALDLVENLARSLDARVYRCSPQEHDRAVAWISHLPVTVSAALLDACDNEPDPSIGTLARQFASSGFRDTSRVGGGNPELGVMMAKYNREEVLRAIAAYRQSLDRFAEAIEQEDWETLTQRLHRTQHLRSEFLEP